MVMKLDKRTTHYKTMRKTLSTNYKRLCKEYTEMRLAEYDKGYHLGCMYNGSSDMLDTLYVARMGLTALAYAVNDQAILAEAMTPILIKELWDTRHD